MSQSVLNLEKIFRAQRSEADRNEERADKVPEGRVCQAVARGQRIHADKALVLLKSMGCDPRENGIMDSADRATAMTELGQMVMAAAREGQPVIESLFLQIRKVAANHEAITREESAAYHVCQVCGFIARNVAPDRCPVCRAQAAQFDVVE